MTTVQDRNNANNIFGGHLLRLASELAYATAVLHAGRHCEAIALGDVSFKQAVPIGCVLAFRAKVGLHPFISSHGGDVIVTATVARMWPISCTDWVLAGNCAIDREQGTDSRLHNAV